MTDFANLVVSDGISGGKVWGTFERKPNGSLRRVVSKDLPLRQTRQAALADLRLWLSRKAYVGGSRPAYEAMRRLE